MSRCNKAARHIQLVPLNQCPYEGWDTLKKNPRQRDKDLIEEILLEEKHE